MKVDLNKVITAIVIAGILSFIGAVYDFQNVKATVSKQDAKIDIMYEDLKEMNNGLRVIDKRRKAPPAK